jgi:hypothetical protein
VSSVIGERWPKGLHKFFHVRFFRWLIGFLWRRGGTPEEEAAQAEALAIKARGREEAMSHSPQIWPPGL